MSRPRLAFVIALTFCVLLARASHAGINFVGTETTNAAPRAEFMEAADLDKDGRTDVVVASPNSKEIDIFLAADTPSHFAPVQVITGGFDSLARMALGDLNADGRTDIVIADQAADCVWVILGRGDGRFLPPYKVTVEDSRHPVAVTIGNFDDAGSNDLAVVDDRLGRMFILRNDNQTPPGFLKGGAVDVGSAPSDVRAADFNGDGKLDLLTLNLGGPRVKEVAVILWKRAVEGFPEFEAPQRYTIGEKPSQMVIADFNKDGHPDVAMLNRPSNALGVSEVNVLLDQASGILLPPLDIPIPCPFFTNGAPCKAVALAAGDFDGNSDVDLMVALIDPRSLRTGDAIQAYSGRGDGGFGPGPVFTTKKKPVSMTAADVTGDGKLDIAVANQSTLDMQVFVNVSTPGGADPGSPCLLGDECITDRCTNGVCCVAQCGASEVCNVPGREGTCVPLPGTPIECATPGPNQPECDPAQFCVNGFCCDEECIGGHCDVDGFIGVCIPGIPDGQACDGDDHTCASNHCAPNFICCREACDGGFCDDTGACFALLPNASDCNENAECESNVCDEFDGICCNRRCNPDTELCFAGEGVCRLFSYTPVFTVPPTLTATPTPRPTPIGDGGSCSIPGDCTSTFCVNNVCCKTDSCGDNQHCEAGTGDCVDGPAGTPTPPPTATRQPTLPTVDPCGGCPSGQICSGNQCVFAKTSGGCSTGDDPARGNLLVVAALPLGLWLARRLRLHRVGAGHRAPRQ